MGERRGAGEEERRGAGEEDPEPWFYVDAAGALQAGAYTRPLFSST